jgi:protein-tyrosine phosphatase
VRERNLTWDGCVNVRDLGGHPTEDGSETRFGAVVRADCVRQLSDAGWNALVAHGIRTIVDLRFHSELEADPPRQLPVDVVHISLLGHPDPERWAEIDAIADAAGDPITSTRAVYLEFLERFGENFATSVAAVADAREGGVCVHCQAGKDRTGLVCALLLRLARVRRETVAIDYAVSGQNLAPLHDRWIAQAEDAGERARRERVSAGPAEAMLQVLEELERRYGSVAEYLLAAGATPAELDRARARLRG